MHLYKTFKGNILVDTKKAFIIYDEWDTLINQKNLFQHLSQLTKSAIEVGEQMYKEIISQNVLAPIGGQEIWAAGVTYLRSRDARMEEAKNAGSSDFYQKVY